MRRLGSEREEIPCVIMGSLSLRDLLIRLRLDRMNQVQLKKPNAPLNQPALTPPIDQNQSRTHEFDSILHEENRRIIPHNIEIPLMGIEPCRKASDITDGVGRATTPANGGEPDEHGRLARGVVEERSMRVFGDRRVQDE